MDLKLDDVLKRIKGKVVCVVDTEKKEFASGYEALNEYGNRGQYEEYYVVNDICAEDDVIILDIVDLRPEINKRVETFEKEHYEKFGVYPNPFDGA